MSKEVHVGPSCAIRPVVSCEELSPLALVLRANEVIRARREFPCGTLLPDGRLDLCKQTIGGEGAEFVADALQSNTHVKHLLMGADRIGPRGAAAVAELVSTNPTIETLYLGCNGIGPTGSQKLAKALRTNHSVRGLWLKRNGIGAVGVTAVAELLQVNRTLRTLDLVDNALTYESLATLVEVLITGNTGVEHLFLCANQLGPASCELLARLVRADTLCALYVSANRLGDEGVASLARGLSGNRRLTTLGLASNGMGPDGVSALVTALRRHPSLTELDLGYAPATDLLGEQRNQIGERGAQVLASWIASKPPLRSLNLAGNAISEAAAEQLVQALEQPSPLVKLNLGRRLPQPLAGQLVTRLCRNASVFPPGSRSRLDRDMAAVRSVYRTAKPSLKASPPSAQRVQKTRTPRQEASSEALTGEDLGVRPEDLATCLKVLKVFGERRRLLDTPIPEVIELRARMVSLLRIQRRGQRSDVHTKKSTRRRDRQRIARTGIRKLRREMRDSGRPDYDALIHELPASPKEPPQVLERARHCYICKRSYRQLHHFYDSLCPACAEDNFARRTATVDLRGRVVLITGARIKIGYQVALKLLRAGARVVATTRFPHDAARRYAREPDFDTFCDRLHIHRVDLRDIPFVEAFAAHVAATYPRLDILINNAAQTVLKPPAFYAHLRAWEATPAALLPTELQPLVTDVARVEPARLGQVGVENWIDVSAQERKIFPPGSNDGHGQPLDLRTRNSWRLRAHEVTTPELLEVHLINSVAPFILVSRLRDAMVVTPATDKYIVNVSAVEGQFQRGFKSVYHPHTNMAKAGLNMLTRTSAADYARDRIYMNSVDTGWITNENPHPIAEKMAVGGFETPIDEIDAAARICHPIFAGIRSGEPMFGHFLKDYNVVPW